MTAEVVFDPDETHYIREDGHVVYSSQGTADEEIEYLESYDIDEITYPGDEGPPGYGGDLYPGVYSLEEYKEWYLTTY